MRCFVKIYDHLEIFVYKECHVNSLRGKRKRRVVILMIVWRFFAFSLSSVIAVLPSLSYNW